MTPASTGGHSATTRRTYPAWFAVRAVEVDASAPPKQGYAYLVFTKASASAQWLEVREPNAFGLPAQSQPQVATAGGYATQVSPSDNTGLALAPDKIPAQDVSFLNVDNIPTTAPRPGLPIPKRPKVINFVNGKEGLTASLTLGAPFAQPFAITIPGFFNGKRQSTSFTLNYVNQLAVYDPPGQAATPQVLATQAALVSGECAGAPCT